MFKNRFFIKNNNSNNHTNNDFNFIPWLHIFILIIYKAYSSFKIYITRIKSFMLCRQFFHQILPASFYGITLTILLYLLSQSWIYYWTHDIIVLFYHFITILLFSSRSGHEQQIRGVRPQIHQMHTIISCKSYQCIK